MQRLKTEAAEILLMTPCIWLVWMCMQPWRWRRHYPWDSFSGDGAAAEVQVESHFKTQMRKKNLSVADDGSHASLDPEFTSSWGNVLIDGCTERKTASLNFEPWFQDKDRSPEPAPFLLTTRRRASWAGSLSVHQQLGAAMGKVIGVKLIVKLHSVFFGWLNMEVKDCFC